MALISVRNLTVSFPGRGGAFDAVDDVSFDVEPGKTLALVGESGCGKTMTALGLLRLTPTASEMRADSVRLRDRELLGLTTKELREVRGGEIAMIFQEPLNALNPVYSVGEQVAEGIRLHEGLGRRAARDRAIEHLREVGIPAPERRAKQYPHELSGGMRQRAMIAMAIACRPALLIADEPTTALDVTVQADIVDLLLRLQTEREMAMLLITHDLGIVAEMAHDVAVMYCGRIVEQSSAAELFARPLHPYTRDLLASVPRIDEAGARLSSIEGTVPDPAEIPEGCAYGPRCSEFEPACGRAQELRERTPGRLVRCRRAKEWLS